MELGCRELGSSRPEHHRFLLFLFETQQCFKYKCFSGSFGFGYENDLVLLLKIFRFIVASKGRGLLISLDYSWNYFPLPLLSFKLCDVYEKIGAAFELITNHLSWTGNKGAVTSWGVKVEIGTDLVISPFLVLMYRSFVIWEWYQVRGSLSPLYYIAVLRLFVFYDHGRFVFCQRIWAKYYAFSLPFNTFKHISHCHIQWEIRLIFSRRIWV